MPKKTFYHIVIPLTKNTDIEFRRYLSLTFAHEAAQFEHPSALCGQMPYSHVYTVGKFGAHELVERLLAIGKISNTVALRQLRGSHLITLVLGA